MAAKRKLQYVFGADISEAEKNFKKMGNVIERTGKRMQNLSGTITKLSAPLIAISGIATKIALDYDNAVDAIAAGTGATGQNLKKLEQSFRSVAKSVPQSMAETSKVIADFNTRTGATGKTLEALSVQALDASRLLGEDVSSVVAESTKAMNDWGVSLDNSSGFLDKIFLASQKTGVAMTTLSTYVYKYGSALRQMGFDVDSTIATLAAFERAGVNTELVMGSLRIALGKLAKAGATDLPGALKASIEAIKNAKTGGEAAAIAIETFGSRAGADMAAAIREGRFEVDELVKALMSAEGQIARTAQETDGFEEKMGRLKNQVSLTLEPLGTAILKVAEKHMPKLSKALDNMNLEVDQTKVEIGLLTAGFVAGTFAIGSYIAIVGSAVKALAGLNAVLAASPVGAALLVGGAAIGTGYMFGKNLNKYVNRNKPTYTPYAPGQENTGMGDLQKRIKKAAAGEDLKAFNLNSFLSSLPKTKKVEPMSGSGSSTKKGESSTADAAKKAREAEEALAKAARKAGEEVAFAIERMEAQKQLSLEITDAVAQGEAKFYEDMGWENSMGLLGDEEYLSLLKDRFIELRGELEKIGIDMSNIANWSEPMKEAFAEIQNKGGDIAAKSIDSFKAQMEAGTITGAEYESMLINIMDKFAEYPAIVKMARDELEAFRLGQASALATTASQVKAAWDDMRQSIALVPDAIGDAFVSAIRGSESLSDALNKVLVDIGAVIAKAFVMKMLFGSSGTGGILGPILGGLGIFGNGGVFDQTGVTAFASGGIVNGPTLFPHAGGIGLMGEAGPEGVFKLKRNGKGELGVIASGEASAPVIINVLDKGDLEQVTYEAMTKYPGSQIVTNHVLRQRIERGSLAFGGVAR